MKFWREYLSRGHGLVLANAGWLWLDQLVRAVVVLVTFGAMARHLGPNDYGILSYALAYPMIFLPLAVIGLDYVVVRELVRRPTEMPAILATSLSLRMGAALAATAAAAIGLACFPADHPVRGPAAVALLVLLGQPVLVFDCWFQSQVASRYAVWARLTSSLVGNAVRLWLVYRGASFGAFAWVSVVDAAVQTITLLWNYRRAGGPGLHPWRDFRRDVAVRLLRAAWPLLLADLAMSGFLRVDQLLLGQLAGPDQLGRYAAAFRLADSAEFFALALINSYFPRLVTAHGIGAEEFAAGLRRFFAALTWVAIGIATAVSLLSPVITRVVLGAKFADTWPVLIALTWANVFVTQIAVRGKWFLMEDLQRYSLAIFALGAACQLLGVWWVAARAGALGAAVSFAVAQGVMALLAPALWSRTRSATSLALRSFWPVKT